MCILTNTTTHHTITVSVLVTLITLVVIIIIIIIIYMKIIVIVVTFRYLFFFNLVSHAIIIIIIINIVIPTITLVKAIDIKAIVLISNIIFITTLTRNTMKTIQRSMLGLIRPKVASLKQLDVLCNNLIRLHKCGGNLKGKRNTWVTKPHLIQQIRTCLGLTQCKRERRQHRWTILAKHKLLGTWCIR